jgi:hypothetical protein
MTVLEGSNMHYIITALPHDHMKESSRLYYITITMQHAVCRTSSLLLAEYLIQSS